jgi:hypothetical protein
VHTVVETPTFIAAAVKAGMTNDERMTAITIVALNPSAGDIVAGGGGIRKIRVPGRGKGKSGGYRVLTYYMTEDEPVFLLSVLNKSKTANLSDAQKGDLRTVAKELRDER